MNTKLSFHPAGITSEKIMGAERHKCAVIKLFLNQSHSFLHTTCTRAFCIVIASFAYNKLHITQLY